MYFIINISDCNQHRSIKTAWKGKLDSHGFRILTNQVPCFDYITEDEMFKIIKESVIFENGIISMNLYLLYLYILFI